MTNKMIRTENESGEVNYISCKADKVSEFVNILKDLIAEGGAKVEIKVYDVREMPLEALPIEIQEQVKNTLRVFNECNVVYEHGRFGASASYGIKASYHYDHFVCGYYKAEEIYTREERRQNFIEEFGYAPCYM